MYLNKKGLFLIQTRHERVYLLAVPVAKFVVLNNNNNNNNTAFLKALIPTIWINALYMVSNTILMV